MGRTIGGKGQPFKGASCVGEFQSRRRRGLEPADTFACSRFGVEGVRVFFFGGGGGLGFQRSGM